MGKVIEVETVVKVDLGEVDEDALSDELESRGYQIHDDFDAPSLADYGIGELLEELEGRKADDWRAMGAIELINALEHMGCPREIINQIDDWDREPIANQEKLDKWLALVA